MSRKPTPETGRFELRATPDELRAWQAAADAEDRSLASWLRAAADDRIFGPGSQQFGQPFRAFCTEPQCWFPLGHSGPHGSGRGRKRKAKR